MIRRQKNDKTKKDRLDEKSLIRQKKFDKKTQIIDRCCWLLQTAMPSGSALLTQSHLHGDLIAVYKAFSGGLDLDPSLFFTRPGLRGHPVRDLQGPSWRQLDSAWKELLF